jgi:hypothetical protein
MGSRNRWFELLHEATRAGLPAVSADVGGFQPVRHCYLDRVPRVPQGHPTRHRHRVVPPDRAPGHSRRLAPRTGAFPAPVPYAASRSGLAAIAPVSIPLAVKQPVVPLGSRAPAFGSIGQRSDRALQRSRTRLRRAEDSPPSPAPPWAIGRRAGRSTATCSSHRSPTRYRCPR